MVAMWTCPFHSISFLYARKQLFDVISKPRLLPFPISTPCFRSTIWNRFSSIFTPIYAKLVRLRQRNVLGSFRATPFGGCATSCVVINVDDFFENERGRECLFNRSLDMAVVWVYTDGSHDFFLSAYLKKSVTCWPCFLVRFAAAASIVDHNGLRTIGTGGLCWITKDAFTMGGGCYKGQRKDGTRKDTLSSSSPISLSGGSNTPALRDPFPSI
jgi:hypothetical protein